MTKRTLAFLAILMSSCILVHAQAPAGATGQCKDGTYSTAKAKSGACSGHKGVQTWYATTSPASAPSSPAPAAGTGPAAATSSATTSRPAPTSGASAMPSQPAAGGGPGQVWVNTSTKVYHCTGDRYYGKTKKGAYMSESEAVAQGARPDAGKSCPK
ncbi:DUF3761 domain-containing protein [Granulicella arctica]|uniref:DUF3761 domain-containing protein n=1 Tax=Granulicella arctica TaxID=940613 RepID=UPI0021DF4AF1|nr:DUF3761 domain-containing protein [Granulicella arctica]